MSKAGDKISPQRSREYDGHGHGKKLGFLGGDDCREREVAGNKGRPG